MRNTYLPASHTALLTGQAVTESTTPEPATEFAVGDRVSFPSVPGVLGATSRHGVVTDPDHDADDASFGVRCTDGNYVDTVFYFRPDQVTRDTAPEPGETENDQLRSELEALKTRYADQCEATRDAHAAWEAEIAKLGELLIQAANDHDLCGELDEYVSEANRFLTYTLPTRTREYTVTRTVTYQEVVTVTATDNDDALYQASESSDWERDDYSTDVEPDGKWEVRGRFEEV